jgi:hypothetical protein
MNLYIFDGFDHVPNMEVAPNDSTAHGVAPDRAGEEVEERRTARDPAAAPLVALHRLALVVRRLDGVRHPRVEAAEPALRVTLAHDVRCRVLRPPERARLGEEGGVEGFLLDDRYSHGLEFSTSSLVQSLVMDVPSLAAVSSTSD